ncbi:MAG: sodium-dependent transporter [Clostridia bacterium]|nr:sodium-dependent transporter [Clostridia bacterium]
MNEQKKRAQWGSKIGFIMAAAGSAVGLGNIWKFPGKAYEGGGAAFILIYFGIVLFIGLPLLISEFSLGRATQKNAVDAFGTYSRKYSFIGYIGVLVSFIIACYYAHVGGWVLRYIFSYATEAPKVYADPTSYFYDMLGLDAATGATHFPWVALLFAFLFVAACCVIIILGVNGGIEKFNKIGMPALFLLLVILLIRSVTMEGASEGLRFMLTPDFSKVTFHTVLIALGQAFYSLSLGMAIMITYGSYLPKKENITKNTVIICVMDTVVATMAGFIIVPAVLATGGEVGKGGGFAFVSLATVFQAMPGGRFFGALFYLLLLFAALTSCISIIESVIAFLTERFGWKRKSTAVVLCSVMFLIGCLYTLSQAAYSIKGVWFDFKNYFSTPSFGDFMELLTDQLMIPLCALGTCIFIGWIWRPRRAALTSDGKTPLTFKSFWKKVGKVLTAPPACAIAELEADGSKFKIAKVYTYLIKYVAPIAIAAILIGGFVSGNPLS